MKPRQGIVSSLGLRTLVQYKREGGLPVESSGCAGGSQINTLTSAHHSRPSSAAAHGHGSAGFAREANDSGAQAQQPVPYTDTKPGRAMGVGTQPSGRQFVARILRTYDYAYNASRRDSSYPCPAPPKATIRPDKTGKGPDEGEKQTEPVVTGTRRRVGGPARPRTFLPRQGGRATLCTPTAPRV